MPTLIGSRGIFALEGICVIVLPGRKSCRLREILAVNSGKILLLRLSPKFCRVEPKSKWGLALFAGVHRPPTSAYKFSAPLPPFGFSFLFFFFMSTILQRIISIVFVLLCVP